MEVKLLGKGDESVVEVCAPGVFDDPIDLERTREFLDDPRHHLAVAVDAGTVVGFVSAVHYLHPDKEMPELWINEVAVAPTHQRRGLARQLLQLTLSAARQIGCTEVWVLTDRSNLPAMGLYRSVGGVEAPVDQVMFTFRVKDATAELTSS
jgi:ribosomal protein S18 acetylase RimI-like enzyme